MIRKLNTLLNTPTYNTTNNLSFRKISELRFVGLKMGLYYLTKIIRITFNQNIK